MGIAFSVVNAKGGVGKTTSAVNILLPSMTPSCHVPPGRRYSVSSAARGCSGTGKCIRFSTAGREPRAARCVPAAHATNSESPPIPLFRSRLTPRPRPL